MSLLGRQGQLRCSHGSQRIMGCLQKTNSRRKVLPTYVDISIWPSLEGGVAGCCRDNNKLAHEKPSSICESWCPEIVSLNQFTESST